MLVRTKGYESKVAQKYYEDSLKILPQQANSLYRAVIHYCLEEWWCAKAIMNRHKQKALENWQKASQEFKQCLELLRQAERPDLEAVLIKICIASAFSVGVKERSCIVNSLTVILMLL